MNVSKNAVGRKTQSILSALGDKSEIGVPRATHTPPDCDGLGFYDVTVFSLSVHEVNFDSHTYNYLADSCCVVRTDQESNDLLLIFYSRYF